jgi:alkylation response protein AidB-like acyl-CoA dehydrogenase
MTDLEDFGLTDEQKLIRRNVAELLARALPVEEIRRLDAASEFAHAAFDALAAAGCMTLPYDPAYGGMGGSRKDLVILVEALARRCAHLAMEIMGGAGYTMAHDVQRLFRDVRVGSIGGGTSDIHRNTIAKMMGL